MVAAMRGDLETDYLVVGFVRLHQPSALYGVDSVPLGQTSSTRPGRTRASTSSPARTSYAYYERWGDRYCGVAVKVPSPAMQMPITVARSPWPG